MALYAEAKAAGQIPVATIEAMGDFCNGVSSGHLARSDELCAAIAVETRP